MRDEHGEVEGRRSQRGEPDHTTTVPPDRPGADPAVGQVAGGDRDEPVDEERARQQHADGEVADAELLLERRDHAADDVLVDLVHEDDEPEHPHRLGEDREAPAAGAGCRPWRNILHDGCDLLGIRCGGGRGRGRTGMLTLMERIVLAVGAGRRGARRGGGAPAPPTSRCPRAHGVRDAGAARPAGLRPPDAPWLVAVFTSATCASCQGVWERAQPLESASVAVQQVEHQADRRPPRPLRDRGGADDAGRRRRRAWWRPASSVR